MKRAWRTTAMGITSIVSAETRGQAIARTLKSIDEAGYIGVSFVNVRAVRESKYDEWASVDETKHCWNEKDIPALK